MTELTPYSEIRTIDCEFGGLVFQEYRNDLGWVCRNCLQRPSIGAFCDYNVEDEGVRRQYFGRGPSFQ